MRKVIKISESDLIEVITKILNESSSKDVTCERCDWSWDISSDDEDPYLCHMCGHRNDPSENKEGVGAYDAPAFEMEPDHTTFRHEYSEQDEDGDLLDDLVTIEFMGPDPFEPKIAEIPEGPIKILNDKFRDKEYSFFDGPNKSVKITYQIYSIIPGRNKNMWGSNTYIPQEGDNSIIVQTQIKKVEIGDMDVTENLKMLTNRGGRVKDWIKWNAEIRVTKIAEMFNLYVTKVSVLVPR